MSMFGSFDPNGPAGGAPGSPGSPGSSVASPLFDASLSPLNFGDGVGVTNADINQQLQGIQAVLVGQNKKLSSELEALKNQIASQSGSAPFDISQLDNLVSKITESFKQIDKKTEKPELILNGVYRLLTRWKLATAEQKSDPKFKQEIQKHIGTSIHIHARTFLDAIVATESVQNENVRFTQRDLLLLAQKKEIEAEFNEPLLHVLVRYGFELSVQAIARDPVFAWLLDQPSPKEFNSTPLHLAVSSKNRKVLKALLQSAASNRASEFAAIVNTRSQQGVTAFEMAVFLDAEELVLEFQEFSDRVSGSRLDFQPQFFFLSLAPQNPQRFPSTNSIKRLLSNPSYHSLCTVNRTQQTNDNALLFTLLKAEDMRKRLVNLKDEIGKLDNLISTGEGANMETDPQRQMGVRAWFHKFLELAVVLIKIGKANPDASNRLNSSEWCPTAKDIIIKFWGQPKVAQYLKDYASHDVVPQIKSLLDELTAVYNAPAAAANTGIFDPQSMTFP